MFGSWSRTPAVRNMNSTISFKSPIQTYWEYLLLVRKCQAFLKILLVIGLSGIYSFWDRARQSSLVVFTVCRGSEIRPLRNQNNIITFKSPLFDSQWGKKRFVDCKNSDSPTPRQIYNSVKTIISCVTFLDGPIRACDVGHSAKVMPAVFAWIIPYVSSLLSPDYCTLIVIYPYLKVISVADDQKSHVRVFTNKLNIIPSKRS